MTGDPCERCCGTLRTYCTRTTSDYVTRYLHCGVCGHKPAENKLIVDLSKARRIIGRRIYKNPSNVVRTPLARSVEGERMVSMDTSKLLLTCNEVAERLGVAPLDLDAATLQGRFPESVALNVLSDGPRLYSWPAVLKWLEDGCPVVRPDLWREFAQEHRGELVAQNEE